MEPASCRFRVATPAPDATVAKKVPGNAMFFVSNSLGNFGTQAVHSSCRSSIGKLQRTCLVGGQKLLLLFRGEPLLGLRRDLGSDGASRSAGTAWKCA